MGKITIIAAIGKNNELGKDNKLIWNIPQDLKFFKDNTMGKPVVMGYNTFKSLPHVLKGRRNIVLSSEDIILEDEVEVFNNFNELLEEIKNIEEVSIIGGASLYNLFINKADRLLLTEIDATSAADVYFPNFDKNSYIVNIIDEVEENNIKYKHLEYIKKST